MLTSVTDPKTPRGVAESAPEVEDEDAKAIRARRNAFVVAALAGLTATAVACSSPQACLFIDAVGDGGEAADANANDATFLPCLSPLPPDAGDDAGERDADVDAGPDATNEAGPQPCLIAPLDSGRD